jgi:hypothetical protein
LRLLLRLIHAVCGLTQSLRPRLLPALDAATAPSTHGSLPALGSRPTQPTAAADMSGPYSAAEVAQYQEAGRIGANVPVSPRCDERDEREGRAKDGEKQNGW